MGKKISSVVEKIKESQNETISNIRQIELDYINEEKQRRKHERLEKRLFKKFELANRGKDFVDIDHVDALGVEYDILLFTSVKNTGKNVGIIYKLFKKYYKQGKKVIFLRTSQTELTQSLEEYNNTPANPFMFANKRGSMRIFHKETGEEVGICRDMKFCNKGSGGEYANYAAIFFDEFMSWSERQEIKTTNLANWAAFISSVTRNKKEGIRIYCTGNLTEKNTQLLDFYGIYRDDKLRYIIRSDPFNPENVCRILYINANNIYKGIKEQVGAVRGMSPEMKDKLFNNRQATNNLLLIEHQIWEILDPYTSFLYVTRTMPVQTILFEIRVTPEDIYNPKPPLYAIWGRIWQPHYTTGSPIFTDDPIVHGTTDKTTLVDNLKDELTLVYELLNFSNLYFYSTFTQLWMMRIMANFKKEIKNIIF